MSEHRLRAIKWKCAVVALYCAMCSAVIVHGWPLCTAATAHGWPL